VTKRRKPKAKRRALPHPPVRIDPDTGLPPTGAPKSADDVLERARRKHEHRPRRA
jgi:hypothetical protein